MFLAVVSCLMDRLLTIVFHFYRSSRATMSSRFRILRVFSLISIMGSLYHFERFALRGNLILERSISGRGLAARSSSGRSKPTNLTMKAPLRATLFGRRVFRLELSIVGPFGVAQNGGNRTWSPDTRLVSRSLATTTSAAAASKKATNKGVLSGLKVVEMGQVIAGPFVGAILGDLGASVVKVERPDFGDDARRMGKDFRHGDSIMFHTFNRSKTSAALDVKSKAGRADLERLIAEADVLVHNLRPGVPEALGVDGPTLCKRYPRLIHGSISAFGHLGPLSMRPGYEPLLQAYSGLSSLNGGEGDPPMRAAPSLCDQGSAMWVVIGILALLHRRSITGLGGIVQSSLLEAALLWAGQKSDEFINTGKLPERHR